MKIFKSTWTVPAMIFDLRIFDPRTYGSVRVIQYPSSVVSLAVLHLSYTTCLCPPNI